MFPCWSTFGRRYIASPRTKDLPGATEQPLNSMGQGGHRGWITGHSFSLCFTSDSTHLCRCATALLGQNSARRSTSRLSSGEGQWVCTLPDPLTFGLLNPNLRPETKHRRTVTLEGPTTWAQTGGGQGTYESLVHRRRDCSLICEGLLNSGSDAIFHSPTTPPPHPCQLPPAWSDFSKKHGAFKEDWSHLHQTLPH